jgi:hypothetical protein
MLTSLLGSQLEAGTPHDSYLANIDPCVCLLAMPQVGAQLQECVIGVLEPIWSCRAPGDPLDGPQRGPLTMRELHLLLTQ